eukprot:scaffold7302_cov159-Ochromonas_danica.AAC.1
MIVWSGQGGGRGSGSGNDSGSTETDPWRYGCVKRGPKKAVGSDWWKDRQDGWKIVDANQERDTALLQANDAGCKPSRRRLMVNKPIGCNRHGEPLNEGAEESDDVNLSSRISSAKIEETAISVCFCPSTPQVDEAQIKFLEQAIEWYMQVNGDLVEYVIKLRICCPADWLKNILGANNSKEKYEDSFYDTADDTYKYGCEREFCRKRVRLDCNSHNKNERINLQRTDENGASFHSYTQTSITNLPQDVSEKPFLTYIFERQTIQKERDFEIYLDTTTNPVTYQVLTAKFVLDENSFKQKSGNVSNVWKFIKQLGHAWVKNELPVLYTKFAFVLQVSDNFKLYKTIFSFGCGISDKAMEAMVHAMLDEGQDVVDRYWAYIWTSQALDEFRNLRELRKYSVLECQTRLKEDWEEIFSGQSPYCADLEWL